jgi:hypothetical protein
MKVLFSSLLLLLPLCSLAEWEKVAETPEAHFYFDSETIKTAGNIKILWVLTDLKKSTSAGEKSRRSRYQFDCKEDRIKLITLTTYSGQMGEGKLLYMQAKGSWMEASQNAIGLVLKTVCEK